MWSTYFIDKQIETLPHFVIRDYQSKSEIEIKTKLKVTWNLEKKKRVTLEEEVDYKIIRSNHIIISWLEKYPRIWPLIKTQAKQ